MLYNPKEYKTNLSSFGLHTIPEDFCNACLYTFTDLMIELLPEAKPYEHIPYYLNLRTVKLLLNKSLLPEDPSEWLSKEFGCNQQEVREWLLL